MKQKVSVVRDVERIANKLSRMDIRGTPWESADHSRRGTLVNQAMKDSLARRYPPLGRSRDTGRDATYYNKQSRQYDGLGSQNTVRSFTQPFLVPPQSSRYERAPEFPRYGSTDTLVAHRAIRRTYPLSSPHASAQLPHPYEGDVVAESPRVYTRRDIKGYDSRIVDPELDSSLYLPRSKLASCQQSTLRSDSYRETLTKGKGRSPTDRMEKQLPPVKHRWTQQTTSQQQYRHNTGFDQGKTTSSSDEALEPLCRRSQRKNNNRNAHTDSSSEPLHPQAIIDASDAKSSSPVMEVRGQSRPVPEEGLRGTSGTKYLDVDEIEEEITCPICMCVLVGTTAASPCGHVFCGGCGLEWIRLHQTCPICRKTLSTPISLSLVPLHVMDALVEKWVKTKGRGWDGLIEWQDRREVWEAQRVVWREDLEAIEMERERGRQESHRSPLGDSGGLPLSDFLLTDFLSLGIHDGVPFEYVGPDPISAFLDEVSRLRRDIRTERERYLSPIMQALHHSPSMSLRPSRVNPHHFSPSPGNDTGWESYSPFR